jgi:glycosyltransferase involved in cell wall biosynthesis
MAETTDHSKLAMPPEEARTPGVLQVLPEMAAGGVPLGTLEIARATVAAGWRAVVVSRGGPGVEALEAAGAKHVSLPVDSKNPLIMWRNISSLRDVITRENIDIVHARSRAPAWSAEAAARRSGRRFVTTFHGTYGHSSTIKRCYNAVMTRGDAVIAISDHIARHIETIYHPEGNRVHVIQRGADISRFDPALIKPARIAKLRADWAVEDGIPVVVLPGRITHWKGQSVLVEAVARLDRKDLICLLIGDDQGRHGITGELRDRIRRLGLEDVIKLVGNCDDMPAAYALADLVVSASTAPEAFGRVSIEAQAMGKPIIASARGGSLETVVDGETGWLIRPGDSAEMAEALQNLWAPRAQLARMGQAGMARARRKFTTEAMCASTLAVYRSLLTAGHDGT